MVMFIHSIEEREREGGGRGGVESRRYPTVDRYNTLLAWRNAWSLSVVSFPLLVFVSCCLR